MKLLNETQVEQLKEIGKYLLQVRQEKSIRIEEVAVKTHIRLAFLQALEAGQFEELPEPVYVQGFIRRYGDVLGLDGAALANTFTINTSPYDSHLNTNTNKDSHNLVAKPNIRIPLFIPYILLLVVAAIGLIYVLNPKLIVESFARQQNSAPTSKQKTAPSPTQPQNSLPVSKAEPAPSSTPSLAVATPESTASSDVEVTVELQGTSWLQVKVDGKTEFAGDLTKGERKTWTAKKQLTVRSGNAGAVLVYVNNQPATPLGEQGAVKETTFTSENGRQDTGVRSQ